MARRWLAVVMGMAWLAGCAREEGPKPATPSAKTKESAATAPASTASNQLEVVPIEKIFFLPAADGKKLAIEEVTGFLADKKNSQPIVPASPPGLDSIATYIPADNPMTRAKVELGRLLYFDPRLSRDNTISCASCHGPSEGWADADQFSIGIKGQKGGRQAPTVMNRAFGKLEFWDGRAPSLEHQALGPIQNPVEMGFTLDEVVSRINEVPVYQAFFEKVFGGPATSENLAKAIASFERTVLVGGAPNDYYTAAEPFIKMSKDDLESLEAPEQERGKKLLAEYAKHKLSDAALRGRTLYFGKAECSVCHVGQNLTDEAFYNIGVSMDKKDFDVGRFAETKKDEDKGAFKTPTLRNIALSAPYMHDGTQKTLEEVVEHYNKGGTPNPHLHKRIKKLNLSPAEKADLVTFMKEGLASPLPAIVAPRLP